MADISRDTYQINEVDGKKHYNKVVFQIGRPILDPELNELQDILKNQSRKNLSVVMNDFYLGDGFLVEKDYTKPSDDISVLVNKGTLFHKGNEIKLDNDFQFELTPSIDLLPSTTSEAVVFIKYSRLEITATEDGDLIDPTYGQETTVREKLKIEIRFVEDLPIPPPLPGENIVVIGKILRPLTSPKTDLEPNMFADDRKLNLMSYVIEGLKVTDESTGGIPKVKILFGKAIVSDTAYSYEEVIEELDPNNVTWIYINKEGQLIEHTLGVGEGLPSDSHALIAKVTTDTTNVIEIFDMRKFRNSVLNDIYYKIQEIEENLTHFVNSPTVNEWEEANSKRKYPFEEATNLSNGIYDIPLEMLKDIKIGGASATSRFFVSEIAPSYIKISQEGILDPVLLIQQNSNSWATSTLNVTSQRRLHGISKNECDAYLFGGLDNTDSIVTADHFEVYDLQGILQSTLNFVQPTGLNNRYGHAQISGTSSSGEQLIFIFGGATSGTQETPLGLLNDLWIYNITTGIWEEVAVVPTSVEKRVYSKIEFLNSGTEQYLILFGGYGETAGGPVQDLWKVRITDGAAGIVAGDWQLMNPSPMPNARYHFGMTSNKIDKIWFFGGRSATGTKSDVWEYQPFAGSSGTFTELIPGSVDNPSTREGMILEYKDAKLFMIGGYGLDNDPIVPNVNFLYDNWELNLGLIEWTRKAIVPERIAYSASIMKDSGIIEIFGGQTQGFIEVTTVREYYAVATIQSTSTELNGSGLVAIALIDLESLPVSPDILNPPPGGPDWPQYYGCGQAMLLPTINDININPAGNTLLKWSEDGIGSLVPDGDATQDLGSPTKRIRDLYISGASIHFPTVTFNGNYDTLGVKPNLPTNLIIDISGVADGNVLTYNQSLAKFEPGTVSSADEKVKASFGDTEGYLDSKVDKSIIVTANKIELFADNATPGNKKFYGTNASGIKGWQDLEATLELGNIDPNNIGTNGVAQLDGSGKVLMSQVPAIAITNVYEVTDIISRDLLTVETGDVVIVNDDGTGGPNTYIYDGTVWKEVKKPTGTIDHGTLNGLGDDDHPQYNQTLEEVRIKNNQIAGDINFNQKQGIGFVVENRIVDPAAPVNGQIWLRTDL